MSEPRWDGCPNCGSRRHYDCTPSTDPEVLSGRRPPPDLLRGTAESWEWVKARRHAVAEGSQPSEVGPDGRFPSTDDKSRAGDT